MKRLLLLLAALIMILSASVAFAEEDPDAVIHEWEEKYGDQRLWDYQIGLPGKCRICRKGILAICLEPIYASHVA